MITLLFGDDSFSVREALAEMKAHVGTPDLRDVNTNTLDSADVSFAELEATCNTVPFLSESRMVIVLGLVSKFEQSRSPRRRSGRREGRLALGEWDKLADYLPTVPETTDLVFVDGRLNRNNPLKTRIRSHLTEREFPMPQGTALRNWIKTRAEAKGADVAPAAVNLLAETIGGDLDSLDSELGKLASYRVDGRVEEQDVRELVTYAREANVFAAVDAIIEGRAGVAIRLARQLLESGQPPSYLLAMIARQVRLVLLVKDLRQDRVAPNEMGRRLRLSDYPLKKTLAQEGRFSHERLVEIHGKLLETDLAIKTGAMDEDVAVEVLIAECALGPAYGDRALT